MSNPVPTGAPPGAPAPEGRGAGVRNPALRRIIEWIHRRFAKLEKEMDWLMELETFLENYELVPRPGEKPVRSVYALDYEVGAIFRGEDYLRATFERPQEMPNEVREFLNAIDEMLKAQDEESRARARAKFEALKKILEEKVEEIERKIEEMTPEVEILDYEGTVGEVVIHNVEPDDPELQDALELALRASYMMVKKDELIKAAARDREEFFKRIMKHYGIKPLEPTEDDEDGHILHS